MTDNPVAPVFTPDFSFYDTRARERARLQTETRPANKTALFDALARSGITRVIVMFDGSGDSGQIESIDACGMGESPVDLPDERIPIAKPLWDGSSVESNDCTLAEALEALAYDFLEEVAAGWEDNEGAYGEFNFDVAARTITLDYNERVLESVYSEHRF